MNRPVIRVYRVFIGTQELAGLNLYTPRKRERERVQSQISALGPEEHLDDFSHGGPHVLVQFHALKCDLDEGLHLLLVIVSPQGRVHDIARPR